MRRFGSTILAAAILLAATAVSAQVLTSQNGFPGAVWTTDVGCNKVDANIYFFKTDVYLNGGPDINTKTAIPPGDYFVRVLSPEGKMLGTSIGASNETPFHADANGLTPCFQLWNAVRKISDGSVGYDTTDNSGNEYKVQVSSSRYFENYLTNSDNFKVDDPAITAKASCDPPEGWLGDVFHFDGEVSNTGRVLLSNVMIIDNQCGTFGPMTLDLGASYTYSCDVKSTMLGTMQHTIVASGDDVRRTTATVTATDACSVEVRAPGISIDPTVGFTRAWQWKAVKTLTNTTPLPSVPKNASLTLHYSIDVNRTANDYGYFVNGSVSVTNTAVAIGLPIVGITVFVDGVAVPSQCGAAFPLTLPAGPTPLTCTFSATAKKEGGTVAASVIIRNNDNGLHLFVADPVAYSFAGVDPTAELDHCIAMEDNFTTPCPIGWSCDAPALPPPPYCDPMSFPYDVTVTNVSADCDSWYTFSNCIVLHEIQQKQNPFSCAADAQVYTEPCPQGCTLTIGYWKNHAGYTGNNADRMSIFLPKYLGLAQYIPPAGKSVAVTRPDYGMFVLSMGLGEPSNGITKLYAQLLAAKLNIANGAAGTVVAKVITNSDNFLSTHNQLNWTTLSKTERQNVINWMSTLDTYNNGLLAGGPPHCN